MRDLKHLVFFIKENIRKFYLKKKHKDQEKLNSSVFSFIKNFNVLSNILCQVKVSQPNFY